MISRRQFLIGASGAAAGLILPDWVARAERYVDGEGEPYLQVPAHARDTLHAIDWGGGELQLFLGDPQQDVPCMTWAEFTDRYLGMKFDDYVDECLRPDPHSPPEHTITAESEVPDWMVLEHWIYHDSPSALAFSYLDNLDLGPEFGASGGLGQIEFTDGPAPGNDSRIVTVPDNLSLSLLQKRLNDLGESIRIVAG